MLDRTKKLKNQKKALYDRQGVGDHPQTGKLFLASDNTNCANGIFKKLVQKNKVQGFLDVLAKRHSQSFAGKVKE